MSDETLQKELTREELYEKVWTIPGTKLAEELGISDVDIFSTPAPAPAPYPFWLKYQGR